MVVGGVVSPLTDGRPGYRESTGPCRGLHVLVQPVDRRNFETDLEPKGNDWID
jgi:hypothetical protein